MLEECSRFLPKVKQTEPFHSGAFKHQEENGIQLSKLGSWDWQHNLTRGRGVACSQFGLKLVEGHVFKTKNCNIGSNWPKERHNLILLSMTRILIPDNDKIFSVKHSTGCRLIPLLLTLMTNFLSLKEMFLISDQGKPILGVSLSSFS